MTSTRTTVRASSFSARRCAVVAPTFPAPTTVILLSMVRGKLMGTWEGRSRPASPSTRVHLPVRIGAQAFDLIQRRTVRYPKPLFGAAIGPSAPRRCDQIRQLGVADAVP